MHRLALVSVWITIASGFIVVSEPAPFDVLMLGLIALLPAVGLSLFSPGLLLTLAVWLVIAAAGLAASLASHDLAKSTIHTLITLYLSVASVILAGFVNKNPRPHVRLVMSAYTWSATLAAGLGIAGYFGLLPGGEELFTSFGRARGTFKDPNVFGPFLVPPIIYAVHLWLTRPPLRAVLPLLGTLVLAFALFLSFSRGAWLNLAVALIAFGCLSYMTAASAWARLKLSVVAMTALAALGLVLVAALQFDTVTKLLDQRASLDQSYDHGPEGRFGGHQKALGLAVTNPLGLGAGQFAARHHHEDVHNVYYSMLLNHGWLGGMLYAVLVLATLGVGLRYIPCRSTTQGELIVIWACFLALAIEGAIVDTDHWRHFFVLMGLLWGLVEAQRTGRTEPLPAASQAARRLPARLRLAVRAAAARAGSVVPTSATVAPAAAIARLQRLSRPMSRAITRGTRRLRNARALRVQRRGRLEAATNLVH